MSQAVAALRAATAWLNASLWRGAVLAEAPGANALWMLHGGPEEDTQPLPFEREALPLLPVVHRPSCSPASRVFAGDFAATTRLLRGLAMSDDTQTRALGFLNRDFNTPDDIGPRRAAAFAITADAELDDDAADAHGFVDDLLRATARLGLRHIDV